MLRQPFPLERNIISEYQACLVASFSEIITVGYKPAKIISEERFKMVMIGKVGQVIFYIKTVQIVLIIFRK